MNTSHFKIMSSELSDWGMWFYMIQECPTFVYECRIQNGVFEVRNITQANTNPDLVDKILVYGRKRTPEQLQEIRERAPTIDATAAWKEFFTFLVTMSYYGDANGSLSFPDGVPSIRLVEIFKQTGTSLSPSQTKKILAQTFLSKD